MTPDPAAPVGLDLAYYRNLAEHSADLVGNVTLTCDELLALLDLVSRQQGVIEAASAVEQSYECCDEVTMRGTVPNYLMGNLMSELIALRSLLPREPK